MAEQENDPNETGYFCDICWENVKGVKSTKLKSRFSKAYHNSDGRHEVLPDDLLWDFVLKEIMKLKDPKVDGKQADDKNENFCGIQQATLCGVCEELVVEGWTLHQNLKKLHKRLEELGEKLKNAVILAEKRSRHCDHLKYNQSFAKRLYTVICPVADAIKEEVPNVNSGSDDDYEDSFPVAKVEAGVAEDESVVGHQEIVTSKRKYRRKPNLDSSSELDDPSFTDAASPSKPDASRSSRRGKLRSVRKSTRVPSTSTKLFLPKGQTSFRCEICEMIQNTRHGFRQHMKAHDQSTRLHGNKYDCPQCKYPALSEFKLRNHLTRAHSEGQRNTCDICGYVGARRWIYEKHMREKHDIKVWTPLDKVPATRAKSETDETSPAKTFSCEQCSASYKTLRGFENHLEDHKTSIRLGHLFDCETCKYPANSEKLLRYHQLRKHKQILLRTCSKCGHQVKRLDQMKLHMKNKHGVAQDPEETRNAKEEEVVTIIKKKSKWMNNKSGDRFRCHLCKYTYADSGALKRHLGEHDKCQGMDSKWECPTCKFPCTSDQRLQRHVKMRHDKQAKIVHACKTCGKTFLRRYQLTMHMVMHKKHEQSFNPETGQFSCRSCPASYTSLAGLTVHQVHAHPYEDPLPLDGDPVDGKSYLCSQCGRSFTNSLTLRKHVRIKHEGRYLNKCEICGLGVEGKKNLERHRRSHTKQQVKDFVCDTCGAGYSTKFSLNKHVYKLHPPDGAPPKDGKTYRCKFCEAVFPFKFYLEKHMTSDHQDKYTHKCDACEKSYISASSLRLHKNISHPSSIGTQTHTCEYCGKGFSHRHYVLCHYKCCPVKKLGNRKPEAPAATTAQKGT